MFHLLVYGLAAVGMAFGVIVLLLFWLSLEMSEHYNGWH